MFENKYRNEKNYVRSLEGHLICEHKQMETCSSMIVGGCSVCIDCGKHSYGGKMEPIIIKYKVKS